MLCSDQQPKGVHMLPKNPLKILHWSSNFWFLSEGAMGPGFVLFAQSIGGNPLDGLWGYAIYVLATGVLEKIVGKLGREIGTLKAMMLLGFFLNALALTTLHFIISTTGFFFVQVMMGLSRALAGPTWKALFQIANRDDHVAAAWGDVDGSGSMFYAFSLVLFGITTKYVDIATAFLVMAGFQLFATAIAALILPIPMTSVEEEKK